MKGIGRAIRSLLLMGFLASIAWFVGFVWFVETLEPARPPLTTRADGIIVLTGGADRSRMASACSRLAMAGAS